MDPQPQQPQQPQQMYSEHKKVGPIIAILIIVLILVIGALYLFASHVNRGQPSVDTNVANNTVDTNSNASMEPQTVAPVTNNSDDVDSINADLNSATKGLDNQTF